MSAQDMHGLAGRGPSMMARGVCSNCGKTLGFKEIARVPEMTGEPITHGLCEGCLAAAYRELAGMVIDGQATLVPRTFPVSKAVGEEL